MAKRKQKRKRIKQKVACNNCSHEFILSNKAIKTKSIDKKKNVTLSYFECPKCKEIYTIKYNTPESKKLFDNVRQDRMWLQRNNGMGKDNHPGKLEYDSVYARWKENSKSLERLQYNLSLTYGELK